MSIFEKMKIVQCDITKVDVDVIVNASNKSLLGGGGVDGAIHRAAGPDLLEECKTLWGCETGEAKITKGYNLKARYIIHTAGPIYNKNKGYEAGQLMNCYRRSMELATQYGLISIAFPAISCGVYGYPIQEASRIALYTVYHYIKWDEVIKDVRFVLFSDNDFLIYAAALEDLKELEGV